MAECRFRHYRHARFFVEPGHRLSQARPDLLDRFHVDRTPTLMVVDKNIVRGKLVEPRGCDEIQMFLAPWLR